MELNSNSTRRTLVTVRAESVRGERRWAVCWREGTKVRRQFFRSRMEAEEAANLRRGEDAKILAEISAAGLTLRAVWESYRRSYQPAIDQAGPTVDRVIAEIVASKEAGGRSKRYVEALKWALESFADGRGAAKIASFTTRDVESWLTAKSADSRSTLQSRVSTLFAFAVRRGYRSDNPCDRLESIRTAKPAPAVFSPRQAARALVWARRRQPRCLAVFVLSLMAGLRPEEAQATTWEAVRLDAPDGPHVVVEAQTSKVRQRRVVYLLPAARAWLQLAKDGKLAELPITRQSWRRFIRELRGVFGWKTWPKDITRHTAASYWLAVEPNVYHVAEALGNSPGILKSNYKALVTRRDSERFWRLIPRKYRPGTAARPDALQ